mmetsp:Transcript_24590/g.45212  ORF Transcript_24590/g.45212 Transcript_24590/m.45212 type:complete len:593 (+) Transcript_24590:110-1888(+)
MSADPPAGEASYCNDRTTTTATEDDRPLICSNPSSYASSTSRSNSSTMTESSPLARTSSRSRTTSRRTERRMVDDPSLRRSNNSSNSNSDAYRRTFNEAYFDEHYGTDPVESVAGSPGRHRSGGGVSPYSSSVPRRKQPSHDPSIAASSKRSVSRNYRPSSPDEKDEHQLVQWNRSSDLDGSAAGNSMEGLADDSSDSEDEDNCAEYYRQLPRPKVCAPEPRPQEQQIVLRGRNLEPDEVREERRLEVREERKGVRTSKEVVATIKNELALVDTTQKYNGYHHCFITIKDEHRFLMLYTFLKRNISNKIIIFFSTTKSTQYYAKLLHRLKFNVRTVHKGQSKEKFLEEFFLFSKQHEGGVLCIPDGQGKDLAIPPSCAWIVQFEPCGDPSEYIFRVGRISSENKRAVCRALLFLTPREFGFLRYYKAAKVKFYEYEISRLANVQKELMRLIRDDCKLSKLGMEAYHAYLMAYASHDYRDIYNVHDLDPKKVAYCFGFDKPPSKEEEDDDEEKVSSLQEGSRTKEQTTRWKPTAKDENKQGRWKPTVKKNENTQSWMTGEKSWVHSNVHADKWKGKNGKVVPDEVKIKSVRLR